MRFCHRMETKKAQRDYPKLWERFNDKAKRSELFQDCFDGGGDFDTMMFSHTRRQVLSQRSKAKFRPLTRAQLLGKYENDAAYVELIVNLNVLLHVDLNVYLIHLAIRANADPDHHQQLLLPTGSHWQQRRLR